MGLSGEIQTKQSIYQALTAILRSGRLCHAYLFSGDPGVGRRTAALWFAASILCRGEHAPCGECISCKKVFAGIHPDVYCYDGKQGINAIHIDVIRELRQDAYLRPNESEHKIYILPQAENMTIGAANALLKVLEEPPEYAMFLLTAADRTAVPETIRSRCICLDVAPMEEQAMLAALQRRFPERTESERQHAAHLSGGIIGRAIEELENAEIKEISDAADAVITALSERNEYRLLAAMQAVSSREAMLGLLTRLQTELRCALRIRMGGRTDADAGAQKLAGMLTARQIEAVAQLIEEMHGGVVGNAGIGLLGNCLCAELMRVTSF